jgi:branched-chain amino acid transport system substrate-binding protein
VAQQRASGRLARQASVLVVSMAGLTIPAAAQVSDGVVKLGVTNDQASIYSAATGIGVVIAAQMAAEDFGGTVLGKKIEIVSADNQNKPDVGVGIVNRWLDTDHVDVIVDGGSSAVGMAVQAVTREKNKLFLITGSGTTALTNDNCSPVGFQWARDTNGLASSTATALTKQGLDSWFFITADYIAGHTLEAQASETAKRYGAKVLGSVRAPFNTTDFGSYLLQAKASGAKVVGLANAGEDATTSIKQAHEFGLTNSGQKLAALFLNITDVHALGLETTQAESPRRSTGTAPRRRAPSASAFSSAPRTRRRSFRPAPIAPSCIT